MNPDVLEALAALERRREARVVLYVSNEQAQPAKSIEDEDLIPFWDCLRSLGPVTRLDLLLSTSGGRVSAARKLGLLLREFAQTVRIIVPFRARSAGTLLCLVADEIVIGTVGELSPLDAHLMASGDAHGGPLTVSSAEIRAFPEMAQKWFGVRQRGDELQLLQMVCNRIFPITLGSFYRAEQELRQVANELLRYHLPNSDDEYRSSIVEKLTTGYYAHDHAITRAEAKHLGLCVVETNEEEERAIRETWDACSRLFNSADDARHGEQGVTSAVIASSGYFTRFRQPPVDFYAAARGHRDPVSPPTVNGRWVDGLASARSSSR